ncbi:hypothetical protein ACLOJK_027007 [Asimina triloba]
MDAPLQTMFLELDIDTAMQRVLKRHISTEHVTLWKYAWTDHAPASSVLPVSEALLWIEYNDRPNAELIMKSKRNADLDYFHVIIIRPCLDLHAFAIESSFMLDAVYAIGLP